MKKKLLAALLAATFAVSGAIGFAACGDDTNKGGNAGNTEQGGNGNSSVIVVMEVKLNKSELTIDEGDSETLIAIVLPDNAKDKAVTWKSSDESVATVKNGTVTAVKNGAATITATVGDKSANCEIIVNKKIVEAEGVILDKTHLCLQSGDVENISFTVLPEKTTEKDVSWQNSDDSVIALDKGEIIALKTGKSNVTVTTSNGKSAICTVNVIGSESFGFTMPDCGFDTLSEVNISFYHSFGSKLRTVLKSYIEKFNKLYPNIKINEQAIGRYYDVSNQINEDIKNGNAPDIAYCYNDYLAQFKKEVLPLNGFLKNGEFKGTTVRRADNSEEKLCFTQEQTSAFIDAFYGEGAEYGDGGNMYSLPLSRTAEIMYYNKTFFENHNLIIPETWDEMEEVCKKIKAIDPNSIPLGYDSESNWFINMCAQYSSPYTSASGENFLFDNTTNRAFVERIKGWYDKGFITTSQILNMYTSNLFKEQKTYMVIGSSAGAVNYIHKVDGKYLYETGVSAVPQIDPFNPKVNSLGQSVCIFKQDDPQRMLASWLFIKYLTTDIGFQTEFAIAGNSNPVLKYADMVKSVTYATYLLSADGFENLQNFAALISAAQQEAYYVQPAFLGSSKVREEVGSLMVSVLKGEKTLDKAFKDAVENCELYITPKNEE